VDPFAPVPFAGSPLPPPGPGGEASAAGDGGRFRI
jgi:hypothetical protein